MNINKQTITWQLILEDEIAYKTLKILLLEFSPSKYELRKHINYWIKTKDYASWKFRLEKLRENKKSSSLEMYIVKFGTELGTEKYNEKLCIGKHSEENYIKKYGEEKGKEKWKFFKEKKKGQATIEYMIKRYGEEKGKEKWEQYQTKRNISYKKRKDLGIKQSNGRTLTRYVEM